MWGSRAAICRSPITSLSGETRPAPSSGASATGGRRSNSRLSTLLAQNLSRVHVPRRNLVERARAAAREACSARRGGDRGRGDLGEGKSRVARRDAAKSGFKHQEGVMKNTLASNTALPASAPRARAGAAAGALLLSRSDVERLLAPDECISAVEDAFRQHALGKAPAPGILGLHAEDGSFHIKAGLLTLGEPYFAAKTNANFPHNGARHGLPTIQGVVVLCEAVAGQPLAVMDSMAITALRTAAATAVAAKYLAQIGRAHV